MTGDVAVTNARIWTGDPSRPRAGSLLIRRGRVVSFDQPPPAGCIIIDAGQRVITPGLIDAHMHLLNGGLSLQHLDLSHVRSRRQFEAAMAQRHAELPAEQWLIAHGWSSENWGGNDPDKSWLTAAGQRPVVAHRMDHHAVLVNDPVLQQCDMSCEPAGGRIVRDAAGQPTGLLVEAAAWKLVNPRIPKPDAPHKQQALLEAQAQCHAHGLTAVGSMEYGRTFEHVFEPLRDQLSLRCRITLLDRDWPIDFTFGQQARQRNDDALAIIGYKTFIDGTLGSRTAWLLEDYADDPGNHGMQLELAAQGHLHEWAASVKAHGFSPSMHAIGDAAARAALDAIERNGLRIGQTQWPARIEHAQQVALDDIPRFRNVIASMQPLHLADDGQYAARRLGEHRLAGSFALRSLQQAGALLAFGSDWPIVSADPLAGLRAAVTGLTRDGEPFLIDQRLTVNEALHAYTVGAARALRMDDAGMLRRGAYADFVMFDRDPLKADWINNPPQVIMTVSNGVVVYDAR